MGIQIKPSADIRNNYNDIATLCKETKEPVFLTKNGRGDLVVMDIETYNVREAALDLREQLRDVEDARENGLPDIPAKEVSNKMREAIRRVADGL